MKTLMTILVCMFCLVFGHESAAQEMVRAGVLDFPPYYEVTDDGKEPTGILIRLMKQIVAHAGLQYTITGLPPRRLYRNLAIGETHLFFGVKGAPEYDEHVLYSKAEITDINLRVYSLKDLPLPESREQLNGKNIIGIRGYSYGGLISYLENSENKINLDLADTHATAFKMLQADRSDFVLDYSLPADTAIRELKISGIREHSLSRVGVYIIIPKKAPQAEELMKRLEASHETLKEQGKLEIF